MSTHDSMKAIERLYIYFKFNDIKPSVFEKELGLGSGYFSIQKSRNAYMGESILCRIIDYCHDLSPTWLLLGEGEMIKEPEKPISKPQTDDNQQMFILGELKGIVLELVSQIRDLAEEKGSLESELKRNEILLKGQKE